MSCRNFPDLSGNPSRASITEDGEDRASRQSNMKLWWIDDSRSYLPQELTLSLLQSFLVSQNESFHFSLYHLGLDLHLLRHGLDLLHTELEAQKTRSKYVTRQAENRAWTKGAQVHDGQGWNRKQRNKPLPVESMHYPHCFSVTSFVPPGLSHRETGSRGQE